MARAPACSSARTCSRTSPCRARTPTSGEVEISGTGNPSGMADHGYEGATSITPASGPFFPRRTRAAVRGQGWARSWAGAGYQPRDA